MMIKEVNLCFRLGRWNLTVEQETRQLWGNTSVKEQYYECRKSHKIGTKIGCKQGNSCFMQ